ncbi:MAG TPA: MTAP family purine nucleoside phosphorylase [Bdellovibrionales bacterium]|nr:MTAP family purine nucleoside phosphorylase [Bdellovibrionales bacterium]
MFAVIGGSGFEKFEGFETVEMLPRETPFGMTSSGFKRVRVAGHELLFVSRHGEHHEALPSEINYRANIYALKAHGARAVISFSAVGSLRAELQPEHMVIPLQYVDRTKGVRAHSFCGGGVVGHMSLAHPVCGSMAQMAGELARGMGVTAHVGGTYVCIEGPNFSTYAESISYRELAADIIGMTNFPEYSLAREAGMSYLPCAFVTDFDCWDTSRPHVTLSEVISIMKRNNGRAFAVLERLLANEDALLAGCDCPKQGLSAGLMTDMKFLTPAQREWLGILRR